MSAQRSFSNRLVRYLKAVFSEVAAMLNVASWFRNTPKFELTQSADIRSFFDAHGWVIVRDVFGREEIDELRTGVQRSADENVAGDLLANPHISAEKFLLHPNVMRLVQVLVPGAPMHFGDASWACGTQGALAFHKDNPDRQDGNGPDWQSPYTLVRFGLYLQSHVSHSGGLALRDKSHLESSINQGRPFAAPSETGDLVAWSLRTTHSGYATRLRGVPKAFVPLTLMALLVGKKDFAPSRFPFRPLQMHPRMALFATFGPDDNHLRRFILHLKTCDYAVRAWQATQYTERMRNLLQEHGIGLIDMPGQTRDIDVTTLNAGYVPLPKD